MFAVAFNRRFGQELNYERLKFKSLGHLLESINDIVRIEDIQGGVYRVYGKRNTLDNSGKYIMERIMKQLFITCMCYEVPLRLEETFGVSLLISTVFGKFVEK